MTRRNRVSTLALISLTGAILTAAWSIAVLYFILPETDEAKKLPFYYLFMDPFVLMIAVPFALMGALIAFTVSLFTLRDCDLRRAIPIVFISVCVAVIVFTPLGAIPTLFGTLIALIVSMVYCRQSQVHKSQR